MPDLLRVTNNPQLGLCVCCFDIPPMGGKKINVVKATILSVCDLHWLNSYFSLATNILWFVWQKLPSNQYCSKLQEIITPSEIFLLEFNISGGQRLVGKVNTVWLACSISWRRMAESGALLIPSPWVYSKDMVEGMADAYSYMSFGLTRSILGCTHTTSDNQHTIHLVNNSAILGAICPHHWYP